MRRELLLLLLLLLLTITLTGVVAQTPYFARTSGRFVGRFWFNLGPNGLV